MTYTPELVPQFASETALEPEQDFNFRFEATETKLLPKPSEVEEGWIAYNPSAIWTIPEGQPGAGKTVVYVRVEPDRSDGTTSHLGRAETRPYSIDPESSEPMLEPFPEAMTIRGEDPQLTRVNRLNEDGVIEKVWVLSVVDAQPKAGKPNEVESLCTRFYWGRTLGELEHFADGPEWMKDIRIAQAGDTASSIGLHVYGRPQPEFWTGSPSYVYLEDGLAALNAQVIADAPFLLDEDGKEMFPIGGGTWGGVNDIFTLNEYTNILFPHEARNLSPEEGVRKCRYTTEAYEHNLKSGRVRKLGTVATASMFPEGKVKADASVILSDVTFPGGLLDGKPTLMTFGLRDGSFGLAKIIMIEKVQDDIEEVAA